MLFLQIKARKTGMARAEKAWSRGSYALIAISFAGVCAAPDHVENPGRRAPFQ